MTSVATEKGMAMSRYIDAEWLKELYKPYASFNGKEYSVPIGAILANIDDAPSIDIVRCRECKWNASDGCFFSTADRTLDDFCSYGSSSEKPNNSND
jgi:predicted PolB exonuclease-like 3'-5' exonuclease